MCLRFRFLCCAPCVESLRAGHERSLFSPLALAFCLSRNALEQQLSLSSLTHLCCSHWEAFSNSNLWWRFIVEFFLIIVQVRFKR